MNNKPTQFHVATEMPENFDKESFEALSFVEIGAGAECDLSHEGHSENTQEITCSPQKKAN